MFSNIVGYNLIGDYFQKCCNEILGRSPIHFEYLVNVEMDMNVPLMVNVTIFIYDVDCYNSQDFLKFVGNINHYLKEAESEFAFRHLCQRNRVNIYIRVETPSFSDNLETGGNDMAVRPFYVSADIDGRKTLLEGGPKSGDGGTVVTIYQRDEGSITDPYKVIQRNIHEGDTHKLITEIQYQGKIIHSHTTEY